MNDCQDCRFCFSDEQLDEPRCEHPVHYGAKTISPAISTARHPTWWGTEACGRDGRFFEPTE